MAERKTATFLSVLVVMMTTCSFLTARAMNMCGTTSAICKFNGRLRGAIIIREKERNQGCISYGNDDPGLSLDIDLYGLDPAMDEVIGYSIEVKSYAGRGQNCSRMGPDFKDQNSGTSNLGTYTDDGSGSVQLSGVLVGDTMSLGGPSSILGRSLAVTKEGSLRETTPTVVDCCIIGMVDLPPRPSPPSPPPLNHDPTFPSPAGNTPDNFNTPTTSTNNNDDDDNYYYGNNNNNNNNRPFPASTRSPGNIGGRRLFPGGSPFSGGAAFNVDHKLNFFDLMRKTSRVHSFSPDRVQDRFRAPEPPRFQDIYGLEVGNSPLSRSGYGNSARPSSRGSSLSRLFFEDRGLQDALSMGLTAKEMNIPRESGQEESSTSFHEDTAVNDDEYPNDDGDTASDSGAQFGQEGYSQGDPSSSAEKDHSQAGDVDGDVLPYRYDEDDPEQVSPLPAEEDNEEDSYTDPQGVGDGTIP